MAKYGMKYRMDEITEVPEIAIPEGLACRLKRLLGNGKLIRLVELLEGVVEETGYGNVTIVVAEGKVQNLKAERSYR
jgi:hypothetical protein